jgi:hypothetical protein|uniref:Uncharacterized protein n=1 Tax=Podoviridae sp. ctefc32 TaxID=2827742 RepID=A0A8S5T3L7_9CAUD|nr:MAG TPA: hypothetical protein [Podoviridae sp. ctefc32]
MNNFTLYEIEFKTDGQIDLLEIAKNFSSEAEIDCYNRSTSRITIRLVSGLTKTQMINLCDDFKIEIESNTNARLIYKVSSITL